MAIAVSNITAARIADSVDRSSYTSGSFTPVADRLYLLVVLLRGDTVSSVSTTTGLAFTSVQSATTSTQKLYVYRALKSSGLGSGTYTVNETSGTGTGCIALLLEVTGMDTSGSDGSGAIVQSPKNDPDTNATAGTVTFSAASAAGNRFFAATSHQANEATTHDSGGGWTEIDDQTIATPTNGLEAQWHATDTSDTVANASWTTSSRWAAIGVEVKAAASAAAGLPVIAEHWRSIHAEAGVGIG